MASCSQSDSSMLHCYCSVHTLIHTCQHTVRTLLNQNDTDNCMVRMVLNAPILGGGTLREGQLTKEPLHGHAFSHARSRYFVLTDDALEWFHVVTLTQGAASLSKEQALSGAAQTSCWCQGTNASS